MSGGYVTIRAVRTCVECGTRRRTVGRANVDGIVWVCCTCGYVWLHGRRPPRPLPRPLRHAARQQALRYWHTAAPAKDCWAELAEMMTAATSSGDGP